MITCLTANTLPASLEISPIRRMISGAPNIHSTRSFAPGSERYLAICKVRSQGTLIDLMIIARHRSVCLGSMQACRSSDQWHPLSLMGSCFLVLCCPVTEKGLKALGGCLAECPELKLRFSTHQKLACEIGGARTGAWVIPGNRQGIGKEASGRRTWQKCPDLSRGGPNASLRPRKCEPQSIRSAASFLVAVLIALRILPFC